MIITSSTRRNTSQKDVEEQHPTSGSATARHHWSSKPSETKIQIACIRCSGLATLRNQEKQALENFLTSQPVKLANKLSTTG